MTEFFFEAEWEAIFIKGLAEMIRCENTSPKFDPEYYTNGFVHDAFEIVDKYIDRLEIEQCVFEKKEIRFSDGVPPANVYTWQPNKHHSKETILFYSYVDKFDLKDYGEWDPLDAKQLAGIEKN